MPANRLSRDQVARLVAADIAPGSYVNVGLGIPTLVAKYLDPAREIVLHSENGILGLRGLAPGEEGDDDLINASKERVQLIPGSSISDASVSFAMMRGGHLDATILGAFQVSQAGDIASWSTGEPGAVPGIGGAMDLVAGARRVIVAMQHTDRDGRPKLVRACTLPLTARRVATSVYTDRAVIDVNAERGFVVRAIVAGLARDELQAMTDAPLAYSPTLATLEPSTT